MTLLSKTAVLSKQVGDFFPIFSASYNILTLAQVELFSFVFLGELKAPKRHFEIN